MGYRSTHQARRELVAVAASQGGYFTAKQAAAAGYGKRHVDYHVKAGNFERIERGLFRLPTIPTAEHDDLIRLSLWSRGRDDTPQAVISHETALAVHGLGTLLPTRTHLSVPPSFRKRPPDGCTLHKATLRDDDTEDREGFRVTTPLRTLFDVAADRAVTQDQLNEIVKQAIADGAVRRSTLAQHAQREAATPRLSAAIDAAEA